MLQPSVTHAAPGNRRDDKRGIQDRTVNLGGVEPSGAQIEIHRAEHAMRRYTGVEARALLLAERAKALFALDAEGKPILYLLGKNIDLYEIIWASAPAPDAPAADAPAEE